MKAGATGRVGAVVRKDFAELRRNAGALIPAIAMAPASVFPAFLVAVLVPWISGEGLADSDEFAEGVQGALSIVPELRALQGDALVQAFLFHQFVLLVLLVPVVGAMALAAHAVIGEKIARTLEPLLATPITTTELLLAKTLSPLGISVVIMWATLLLYIAGVATLGEPSVWRTLLSPRVMVLFFVLGPLVAHLSLQLAVIISSRVNDPRSAQQLGALVVLPITAVFIGQLFGQFILGVPALLATAAGLLVINAGLSWVGVRVFQRERIVMRWR